MIRAFLVTLLAAVSLIGQAHANVNWWHDSREIEHDLSRHHREHHWLSGSHFGSLSAADRETARLFHDAERAMREQEHKGHHRHHARKLECDRLEMMYYLRHPPGTKPEGLRGAHGCVLYRADAHYHDMHPTTISILGDNIYIGLR